MESILTSIKKLLGPSEVYDHFDPDIIMHINTAISNLTVLGVGKSKSFRIEDDTATWNDLIPEDDDRFDQVKTYIYLRVKLVFDPPTTSSVLDAMQKQADKLEWLINVAAETE